MTRARLGLAGAALVTLFTRSAGAVETQACLDASQKGQDARDAGKLLEARQHLATCADPSCPQPVPTYCADWLKDVNRRVPTLVFRVTDGAGRDIVDVTTKIDDVVVSTNLAGRPIELNPGSHRIAFERGAARIEQTVLVVDSEKGRVVTAVLQSDGRAAPPAPAAVLAPSGAGAPETVRPIPTVSWVAWGVGAASLVGFGIFGLKARSDFDHFKSTCGSRCTTDDRDSVKSTVLLADVLLAVGLVAVGVGTFAYLTRRSVERPTTSARASHGPRAPVVSRRANGRVRYVMAVAMAFAAGSVACGLVIDADELVADIGSPPGADAPSGDDGVAAETGANDANDANANDATGDGGSMESGPPIVFGCRAPPAGSIAACVPAPPSGTELVAAVWGRRGTPLPCPSGYSSAPALTGYGDIEKAPPPCSPTGCVCDRIGTPTCKAIMQYYSDALCKTPTKSAAIDTRCERSEQSGQPFASPAFPLNTAGVTCKSTGASSTMLEPATLCTTMNACRKDPAVVLPACAAGMVALPAAANARACYRASGACAAPYVAVAPFSTQQQVSDTRACGCACALDTSGACAGGTASVFGQDNDCLGNPTTTLGAGCRANSTYNRSVKLAAAPTVPNGVGTCKESSSLTGALTLPASDIALCCLPE